MKSGMELENDDPQIIEPSLLHVYLRNYKTDEDIQSHSSPGSLLKGGGSGQSMIGACLMVFSHQSKTTTRQRQDDDKTTTRQRQDNDKTTTRQRQDKC